MTIFFDTDTALTPQNNTSFSKGTRTDFWDNASSAFSAFRRSELFTSERNNLEEEYINVVDILTRAGHSGFVSPLDQDLKLEPLGSGASSIFGVHRFDLTKKKSRQELEADFWNKVTELQTTDENLKAALVEAGLDTPENMKATIAKKAHSAWEEYQKINERATTGGKIGGFAGIAGGAFTDPIMIGAAVGSFGYSVPTTVGAAALRIAYMEAIIGGVAETIIQLKAQPYRKELGFEDAGLETGLKNIAMVTGASGILSPALYGAFKAFGKGIDVGKKYLTKIPTEELQIIKKELNNINPKFKDNALDNYEFPKKDIPDNTPAARTEHKERLNTAVKQFQNGEPVDLPPIKNKIIYHGTDKYFKKFDLNKTADQSIWFTDDINAIKAGKVGASGKGNIIERIIDENKIKLATAEQADKLTDDQLIAQGFEGVKFEKTAGYDDNTYRIFNTEKLDKTGSVQSKSGFNKNQTKLAEDIEGVKDFDVPTEAAYRNQALNNERSVFDVSTSNPIKSSAGTGAAAKTSPTELSDATQALSKGSQATDATPVSVLAKANTEPPLFRGSVTNRVGDISDISKDFIYHKSDNFNEIYNTLSKKMNDVKKDLQPIATKYNGDLKARIKDIKELNKKLKHKTNPKKPEHISDYLGARISTDTIFQAKMVLSDLNKQIKFIQIDDFLSDTGRAASEYRAIHAQALTKDGFSFELQIRVKELDPLTEKSHTIYKKKKWAEKEYTDAEYNKIVKEEAEINKKLKAKYFEIKDKEFSRLNSKNEVDVPIVIGTRLDENGEIVALTKTARELFEEEAKDQTAMKRLEQCMGW